MLLGSNEAGLGWLEVEVEKERRGGRMVEKVMLVGNGGEWKELGADAGWISASGAYPCYFPPFLLFLQHMHGAPCFLEGAPPQMLLHLLSSSARCYSPSGGPCQVLQYQGQLLLTCCYEVLGWMGAAPCWMG